MPKKILLTRPRSAGLCWAALLARHGFDCVAEPLLHLTPTDAPRPHGGFQAVMITSANAPEALMGRKENLGDLFTLPCFCVGAATGSAAQILGFTDIRCGTSDSAALAYLVIGSLIDKTKPVLHIAGDIVDNKAQEILAKAGFTVTTWPVYSAVAAQELSESTRALLATGAVSMVPVFSPRSAHILVTLIEKHGLSRACHPLTAIGLSQAVADVLQKLPWRRLCVAATPSEEGVLTCLLSESAMPVSEPVMPPPLPTPAPCRRAARGWLWALLGIVLLSGAGTVALTQCPWFVHSVSGKDGKGVTQNIDALEDRVRMLESRLDAQQAQPAAAQDSDAALADTVKNLQAQVAQLQSAQKTDGQNAQKWVAAAFAFWDLRNAVNQGRGFAPQLAALHDASENDAVANAQMGILFSYTAGVPTLAQLHDELAAHEPAVEISDDQSDTPVWENRIKKILGHLVSVHALHQPQFDALENALAGGDDSAALAAFNALPEDAKQKLSGWQAKLQSRIAVDDALHIMAVHFASPPSNGENP